MDGEELLALRAEERERGVENERTGTVWDSIVETQSPPTGSHIPKSFTLTTPKGQLWIHPNVTEHMYEIMKAFRPYPKITEQVLLKSFETAINSELEKADKIEDLYGKMLTTEDWEFKIGAPRTGLLPTMFHGRINK